jgi:hypothetical protein
MYTARWRGYLQYAAPIFNHSVQTLPVFKSWLTEFA